MSITKTSRKRNISLSIGLLFLEIGLKTKAVVLNKLQKFIYHFRLIKSKKKII